MQPWQFVAIGDPSVKHEIRVAGEEEEREFYEDRAPAAWLEALAPLGTDSRKPFLEIAPWLIAVFAQPYSTLPDGSRKHYYATESVGIATGLLVAAIHQAGLVALTHTPSPMAFLNRFLARPAYEKPFLLLVVGHPAADARFPTSSERRWTRSARSRFRACHTLRFERISARLQLPCSRFKRMTRSNRKLGNPPRDYSPGNLSPSFFNFGIATPTTYPSFGLRRT